MLATAVPHARRRGQVVDHGSRVTSHTATLAAVATLATYLDFECNGPGSSVAKDLSGNDLSGTLKFMKTGSCGSG